MAEFDINEFNKRVLNTVRGNTPATTNTMPGQMPRFLAYLQSRKQRMQRGLPEIAETPPQPPVKNKPLFPFVGR
jgi:hypothetical protein